MKKAIIVILNSKQSLAGLRLKTGKKKFTFKHIQLVPFFILNTMKIIIDQLIGDYFKFLNKDKKSKQTWSKEVKSLPHLIKFEDFYET